MIRYFTLFVVCFFLFNSASAQYFRNRGGNRNLLITAGTGTTHYYGDLARNGDNGNIRPNFYVGARYNFYGWFSAGADLGWFQLHGDDKTDPIKATRNLSFLSNNFELNFTIQASLFQERKFYLRRFANPFVYVGLGAVNFNPTAELDGQRYQLRPLETEGVHYGSVAMTIPMGGGVKFRINPFFNLVLDWSYHFTSTDYLDDVSSGIYPAPSSFTDDIARKLSDRTWETLPPGEPTWAEQGKNLRGDPDKKDGYMIFNLKVEYYLSQLGNSNMYGSRFGFGPKKIKPGKIKKRKQPSRGFRRRVY